jgi:predicted DCC family thiol-disulfide oxidoreductase YuxK
VTKRQTLSPPGGGTAPAKTPARLLPAILMDEISECLVFQGNRWGPCSHTPPVQTGFADHGLLSLCLQTPPLLAYDGDCGFCTYWVRYWQRLTGARVRYAPYQTIAADHPEVSEGEFAAAIQLFEAGGVRYSGAEAAFQVLALAPVGGASLWLYHWMPGFAALAEAVYRLVARHRVAAYHRSRLLWGAERFPSTWHLGSWLFLRLLGLASLVAFVSIGAQILGLVGSDGILPIIGSLAPKWLSPSLSCLRGKGPIEAKIGEDRYRVVLFLPRKRPPAGYMIDVLVVSECRFVRVAYLCAVILDLLDTLFFRQRFHAATCVVAYVCS